jgi:hypothetical protein
MSGPLLEGNGVFNHHTSPAAPPNTFSLDGSTEDVMTSTKSFYVDDVAPGTTICYMFSVFPATGNDAGGGGYLSQTVGNSGAHAASTGGDMWRHSRPICAVVAKRPLASVQGAGLYSKEGVGVNQTEKSPCFSQQNYTGVQGRGVDHCYDNVVGYNSRSVFGSWSEYEIISGHGLTPGMMASGAVFAYTVIPRTTLPNVSAFRTHFWPSQRWHPGAATIGFNYDAADGGDFPGGAMGHDAASIKHNPLTITNQGGYASHTNDIPMHATNHRLLIQRLSELRTIGDENSDRVHKIEESCDFGNVAPRRTILCLQRTGTITISQNIEINGVFNNIADIPQVIIMAPNIVINPNVERVDAWLITAEGNGNLWQLATGAGKGEIFTCGAGRRTVADVSASGPCNRRLVINGPVIAGSRVHKLRTYGAGVGVESADPAEIFNLGAEAYLWIHYRIQDNRAAHTSVIFELAPRL